MTVFPIAQLVDLQNNSMQNVDRINDESGGDVRIENGLSCAYLNAKMNLRCNNIIRVDVDGNVNGNNIHANTADVKSVKCTSIDTDEIRCAETIAAKVLDCDRLNTAGSTRLDHAGNLSCLTGKIEKYIDTNEIRTGGSVRVDNIGNISGNSVNACTLQTSGVTRIDPDGVIAASQVVLVCKGDSDSIPICISSSAKGNIAITPLGTSSAIPKSSFLTGNSTDISGEVYVASDSMSSAFAYRAFAGTGSSWVCNVDDGYGFFGNYDGKTSTLVNGRALEGEWVQLTIPDPKGIISYTLTHDIRLLAQRPKSWTLVGSVDGENFFNVHTHTIDKVTDLAKEFLIPLASIAIRHFRVIVTSIFPFSGNQMHGSITIENIVIEVGFGKDQARLPKHMLDVSGTICAEALAFEHGPPIKMDAGFFKGSCATMTKFSAHFRNTPAVTVSVVNCVDAISSYAEITSQSSIGFMVRQWTIERGVATPTDVCVNWTAIGN